MSLPNTDIVAATKKQIAEPNTLDMKIVKRKKKKWPADRVKPIIK